MATTPSTNLDFDSIKSDLIAAVKADPVFTDYNFEGSALNTLFDILANNTFNNAFLASAVHAENFLDSAQLRPSVVSRATEMGYTPQSVACSAAYLNITARNLLVNQMLTRGTQFASTNENGSYIFNVVEDVISTTVGNDQVFSNVRVIEGTLVENKFNVDTQTNLRNIYTIPNASVDTKTLRVFIRPSASSVERTELQIADIEYGLNETSNVYFLQESYDGFFQIYFGDNVVGKALVNGNIIEISYFVTKNYNRPDGCRAFVFTGAINGATSIDVVASQVAVGGSLKESIDSIKLNAKKSNSAKKRNVKESDYELSLVENFTFVKAASVWGGEKNDPPVYGKVFIAIQPKTGFTITNAIKQDVLTPAVRKKSMINAIPEFVDPEYLFLSFNSSGKYTKSKTTSSKFAVANMVKTSIANYIDSISTFNKDYINSTLVTKTAAVDPGLVGFSVTKRVAFRVAPLISVKTFFNRKVHNSVKLGSIFSTKFKVFHDNEAVVVSVKEIPDSQYTTLISGEQQVFVKLGVYTDTSELIDTIGTVNVTTGKFDFFLNVFAYLTANRFVQIYFELNSDDIISKQKQILILEQNTASDAVIGLSDNNTVELDDYTRQ
jgi:hypothetical protein